MANRFMALAVCGMALLGVGCGEDRIPRDVQRERAREQMSLRQAEIDPVMGEYEGTLHEARSDREAPFRINLIPAGESYEAGVPDEIKAPTIAASVYYYAPDSVNSNHVDASFDGSDYDAKSGTLRLFMGKTDTINSTIKSGKISGIWTNAARGVIGTFEAVRVRRIER